METIKPGKFIELAYDVYEIEKGENALMMKFTEEHPDKFIFGVEKDVLPDFEKGLQGLKAGDTFDMTFSPKQAFGEHMEEYVMELDKSIFCNEDGEFDSKTVHEGNVIPMMTEEGYRVHGIVLSVTNDKVTVDFNHPLAGKTVRYTGKVVTVRDAKAEDMEPQHPCGCGSCGHDNGGCSDGCGGCNGCC